MISLAELLEKHEAMCIEERHIIQARSEYDRSPDNTLTVFQGSARIACTILAEDPDPVKAIVYLISTKLARLMEQPRDKQHDSILDARNYLFYLETFLK